jgi:16S rRNA (guanine527-N7)-methyltransferase
VEPSLERKLIGGAALLGVDLGPAIVEALGRYLELLLLWNRRVNLTAVRIPEEIIEKHFVDSLAVLPHVPVAARSLVDVGTGGGFPGAVIALARPTLAVTLVESVRKKVAFLEALRRELPLRNVAILAGRVEDCTIRADVAVSRATWDLPEWLERGARLVVPGGLGEPGGYVLGMEGAEHHPLPPGAERHPYPLGRATRAVVVFHVERPAP